jgi:hypothetical protein
MSADLMIDICLRDFSYILSTLEAKSLLSMIKLLFLYVIQFGGHSLHCDVVYSIRQLIYAGRIVEFAGKGFETFTRE